MELINQANIGKKAEAVSNIRIQDIFSLFLSNWYWFVLSLFITIGTTVVYLLTTPPVYTRSASILIKDDSKGSGISGSEGNAFSDLGMFKVKTNVNNEMISIKSPAVIQEVVRRLHLNVNYQSDGHFHRETLYGTTLPVTVDFKKLADNDEVTLTLLLTASKDITVKDITLNGEDMGGGSSYTGKIGKSIKTAIGELAITATDYYKENLGDIYVTRTGIVNSVTACRNSLVVAQNDENSTIIDLSYNDVNTQRAEDVLNMLISVYNENWVKDKNQIAYSTSQFIDERLEVIEKELGNVDNDISSYKSKHLVPDIQAASSMYMAQASEASAQIQQLNNQLYIARYLRNIVGRSGGYQLLPANLGTNTPAIDRDVSEYNELVLQYNSLLASSSADNPFVMEIEAKLKALRSSIVHSIDNQINALNTQLLSSQNTKMKSTAQIASNPGQAKYLLSVERQQKVKESLYLFLLQKREENELSQAFTAYNTRVITPPTGSLAPTSPERRNLLLIALLIGLAVPATILFLKENMNTKVRGRKDIEHMTIPFIGEIPQYGSTSGKWKKKEQVEEHNTVLVKAKSRNLINEAFRVVRSNMEFMAGAEDANKVIMFTSVNSGSGKTFLTVNLAASFAIKERHVIAIDLDMRRASLSQYANKPSLGVANYLNESVRDWRTIVVHDENNAYLDILPVGTVPPNPAELLYSPRLQKMLDELRQQYDMIFIDCPPYEVVADTSIISKWADMTVFVIRAELLEREMLPVIEDYYTEKKFNNMSILLNGTTSGIGRYGYHRYGYHYGYGYGYHEEDKRK